MNFSIQSGNIYTLQFLSIALSKLPCYTNNIKLQVIIIKKGAAASTLH